MDIESYTECNHLGEQVKDLNRRINMGTGNVEYMSLQKKYLLKRAAEIDGCQMNEETGEFSVVKAKNCQELSK